MERPRFRLRSRLWQLEKAALAGRVKAMRAAIPPHLVFPDAHGVEDLPPLGGFRGKVYIGFRGPDEWDEPEGDGE